MNGSIKPWLGCGMLGVLGLFFAANADDPAYSFALAWLVIAVLITGLVALVRRGRSATSRRSTSHTVAICVGAPLMPVPSLRQAYLSMPDHCRAVLGL